LGNQLSRNVGLAVEPMPQCTSRDALAGFCTLFGAPLDDTRRQDEPLGEPNGSEGVSG
jgi:hypothetical protein